MNIIEFIQPVNLEKERVKFMGSRRYQPRFEYGWENPKAQEWIKVTVRYHDLAQALMNQDYAGMTRLASEAFMTVIDIVTVKKAWAEARAEMVPLPKWTVSDLVLAQQKALAQLGIDYAVVVSGETGFNARPVHAKKQLVVSREISVGMFSVASSVRHDMSHIVRYVNGKANGFRQSGRYLPTEEGLATYWQDYGGDEPNNSLKQHAAEYAVTEVVQKGSLRDGYEYLVDIGLTKELAWQRAARHKYGWMDTHQPGDIMKPAMYYYWSQKVKRLTADERLRLMTGKIAIDELGEYLEYKGAVGRESLRLFFN